MIAPATTIILLITALSTLYAFQRPDIRERWMFDPEGVLVRKEYYRMFTSGLIHADWIHFAFNAISFLSFAKLIEFIYGAKTMLVIYVSSIVGGSLLSLIIHRHHEYRALGASGGVCGIIFASIFLLPGGSINLFFFPVSIPAYAYAVLFLIGSFVAHRRGTGNIGHDAHLGGAIVGLLAAAAMYPKLIFAAPLMFAGVLVLSLVILFILIFDPLQLLDRLFGERPMPAGGERSRRYEENSERNKKIAEMDKLLDLVAQDGVGSLSNSQRKRLEQLSKDLYYPTGTANAGSNQRDK